MARGDDRITTAVRPQGRTERTLLTATRVWLPIGIVAAGVIMIAIAGYGPDNPTSVTGMVLIGTALMVWMLNWLFRMSVSSNHDRVVEEQAREYFDRTGRWPDEERD